MGATVESIIWKFLENKGLNPYGIAGLMGNLYAESGLRPENLQNTGNKKLNMTDAEYIEAVDSGKYTFDQFRRDSQGVGLAQWTFHTRKAALYNYARKCGKSIGDLEIQLEFLYKELSENYKGVLKVLQCAGSVLEASNAVLLKYERPANQSVAVQNKRAQYGMKYYNKYAVTYFEEYRGYSKSIVDALNAIGADSSFSYRKQIAKANGITSYKGTGTQNGAMLDLLRIGKLIKP